MAMRCQQSKVSRRRFTILRTATSRMARSTPALININKTTSENICCVAILCASDAPSNIQEVHAQYEYYEQDKTSCQLLETQWSLSSK